MSKVSAAAIVTLTVKLTLDTKWEANTLVAAVHDQAAEEATRLLGVIVTNHPLAKCQVIGQPRVEMVLATIGSEA